MEYIKYNVKNLLKNIVVLIRRSIKTHYKEHFTRAKFFKRLKNVFSNFIKITLVNFASRPKSLEKRKVTFFGLHLLMKQVYKYFSISQNMIYNEIYGVHKFLW